MKAFKIDWAGKTRMAPLDLACEFSLPSIRCYDCGRTWCLGTIEYPAFNFGFLNDVEFTDDRVLSVEEFAKVSDRIVRAANRSLLVTPGGSIGPLCGEAFRAKFDDFAWGRVVLPQISKRARDILAGEGIHLLTGEMNVTYRGKRVTSHLGLQVEPVPLLTEENLKQWTIVHCPTCGDYTRTNRRAVVPEGFMIGRSKWPKGQHLVMLRETLDIIASEDFIEAVRRKELTGLSFVECGQFV